jgi:hypothetical protein
VASVTVQALYEITIVSIQGLTLRGRQQDANGNFTFYASSLLTIGEPMSTDNASASVSTSSSGSTNLGTNAGVTTSGASPSYATTLLFMAGIVVANILFVQ